MTKNYFSEMVGVDPSTITRLFNGKEKRPNKTLMKLIELKTNGAITEKEILEYYETIKQEKKNGSNENINTSTDD